MQSSLLAVSASPRVSPATKRRAKPCFMPRRAMELVTLRLVESQKIKLRTSMNPPGTRRQSIRWRQTGVKSARTGARRKFEPEYASLERTQRENLNGADCSTFAELGVGSKAEGFQHAGLHSL